MCVRFVFSRPTNFVNLNMCDVSLFLLMPQTNVYPSARRHKMLLFSGFRRRAAVVFPSDEEWQRRRALNKTKEVPEVPLLKVKGENAEKSTDMAFIT